MIYFAAPLFNEHERQFNETLAARIEAFIPVFLPQRDATLLVDMLGAGVPLAVAEARVFTQDCDAMQEAWALVAVLDGAHIDEGVAFEIGYMFSQGKLCLGLQTDVRRTLPSGNNPMIGSALEAVFSCEDELVTWVANNTSRLTDRSADREAS